MNQTHVDKKMNQLPNWLWINSTSLPGLYKMVWQLVKEDKARVVDGLQSEILVDTNKVFPLLLTSQLPTDILGHIWSLANQKYAGQLTEQELYIVLALVAAAQSSYTFGSLDILHLFPVPLTPYLNIDLVKNTPCSQSNHNQKHKISPNYNNNLDEFKSKSMNNIDANLLTNSTLPSGDSSDLPSIISGASLPVNVNRNNPMEIGQLTKSLSSDMKHTISSVDPGDDFSEFQSAPMPTVSNISIFDTKQGCAIGSRLANHNLGVKKLPDKLKRSNTTSGLSYFKMQNNRAITTKVQSSSECLTELFSKCPIKNYSKTVILKDTVIRNSHESSKDLTRPKNTYNSAPVKSEHSNQITPSEEPEKNIPKDLMSIQLVEDKYSALRELIRDTSSAIELNNENDDCSLNDEFGDFVSAEQSSIDHILESEYPVIATKGNQFQEPLYTDKNNVDHFCFNSGVSEALENLKLDPLDEQTTFVGGNLESSLDISKHIQKEDTISINSIETPSGLTRSGSVPSLDLKSFLPSNAEDDQVVENMPQAVYWEWKQYMESCVLLLQVGVNIFSGITSESVLREVLNSAHGYNFLCNLAEVAAVCRRVNFSYKEMNINIMGFDDLLMDIDRIWAEMEPYYADIPIVTELPLWPLHQRESISCSLCLTVITSGRVTHNENNYHVTCANLWLNCVNSQLPVMRYSSFHSNPVICPSNAHT